MAEATRTIRAGRRRVAIARPGKELFPGDGVGKWELAEHLVHAAPRMLPLLRGHPLALHRRPDGIGAEGFFQKQVPDSAPDWLPRAEVPRESGGSVVMATAEHADALAWFADQSAIEQHPLLSRQDRLRAPDRLVFDLDPPDDDFGIVREAAAAVHGLLDELGLPGYLMTSGSRGLHVHVPLRPEADFTDVRAFAVSAADLLAARHPDRFTTAFRKEERGRRLFLDVLRNQYAQHSVAPYSVRARPGAPVAMPLSWEELDGLEGARRWRLSRPGRLRERLAGPDPWQGIRRRARTLTRAARRLRALSG